MDGKKKNAVQKRLENILYHLCEYEERGIDREQMLRLTRKEVFGIKKMLNIKFGPFDKGE